MAVAFPHYILQSIYPLLCVFTEASLLLSLQSASFLTKISLNDSQKERERERENVSSNSLMSGRHFSLRVERTFTRHGCQSLIKNNSQNQQLQVLEDKALITHSGSSKPYQEFGWAAIFHHCLLQGLRMGNSSHHLIKN
ncbi:unnamed protein product [Rangifer tarandus platyrhynchus]|uniref:Uncharacterized protein n=2 Tax=Rangifer tarandus platyrhynchus TaxID=3082113 RepID=A0ABN8Y2Y4_RANTA|nr:unnamed protein product [Rangifer tarandus platyrhynchus]